MTRPRNSQAHVFAALFLLAILAAPAVLFAGEPRPRAAPAVDLWLTVLHSNDGESQLLDAGRGLEGFGGAGRFATLVRRCRCEATRAARTGLQRSHPAARAVVLLNAGDNFLAGPEFSSSLEKGVPFFDRVALDLIGYDAFAIGNHEFDFGPDVLAAFIGGSRCRTKFLSSNLDVGAEPALQKLAAEGRIAGRAVLRRCGRRIGVVGATTERLSAVSSPRHVTARSVRPAVQAEIDALVADGVTIVILISHLQSVEEDIALLGTLDGVDIAIAGGGDELLANPGDLLLPGDESHVAGAYPLRAIGADGASVPVVTTSGSYRYLGQLVVGFDRAGRIVLIDEERSGPRRVAGCAFPDGVRIDARQRRCVLDPVRKALEALVADAVGRTEVALDGRRGRIRTAETNLGNLVADALRSCARARAAAFGVPLPTVAFQNGGGIRNDDLRGPGPLTRLDTFDVLPFPNFVCVLPGVSRERFKEILENAVSRVESGAGGFLQVSGFTFTYCLRGERQVLGADGRVATPGTRVVDVTLADGTVLVRGGAVVDGPPLVIATTDFLARGGDQFPLRGVESRSLGLTAQQALCRYVQEDLGGVVSGAAYPEGGQGRITRRSWEVRRGSDPNLTVERGQVADSCLTPTPTPTAR